MVIIETGRVKGETSEVVRMRHTDGRTDGRNTLQCHMLCQEIRKLKLIVLKEC